MNKKVQLGSVTNRTILNSFVKANTAQFSKIMSRI